jgi:NAD(P)-dependent dehydrogenase (short-subunit alcohol dehydrogenase family)
MTLDSQTWIVTGAASGMGRAVARAVHSGGGTVVAADRDETGLAALASELDGCRVVTANVADAADADRIVAAAEGSVDVLVNNAALMDRMLLVDETPEDFWERVVSVNLTAPFLLSKRVLPGMVERGRGVIINIASIAGIRGSFAGAAYTATKHGLVGLTKSIAHTYRADGIRCMCVCPGATAHGSKGAIEEGATFSERGWLRVAGGEMPDASLIGRPEDIASLVLFAASDAAVRLNGTALIADDGATL